MARGRKSRKRLAWRADQTVWVLDPKTRRWHLATVVRDVLRGDDSCLVSYTHSKGERIVFISVGRQAWGEHLRRYDRRPTAAIA